MMDITMTEMYNNLNLLLMFHMLFSISLSVELLSGIIIAQLLTPLTCYPPTSTIMFIVCNDVYFKSTLSSQTIIITLPHAWKS